MIDWISDTTWHPWMVHVYSCITAHYNLLEMLRFRSHFGIFKALIKIFHFIPLHLMNATISCVCFWPETSSATTWCSVCRLVRCIYDRRWEDEVRKSGIHTPLSSSIVLLFYHVWEQGGWLDEIRKGSMHILAFSHFVWSLPHTFSVVSFVLAAICLVLVSYIQFG